MIAFLEGRLYSGRILAADIPRLSKASFDTYYPRDTRNLPKGRISRPTPHTRREFLNLNELFFECMGTLTSRDGLRGLEASTNRIKGALFGLNRPMSDDNMQRAIANAILTGTGEDEFLIPMRRVSPIRCCLATYLTSPAPSDRLVSASQFWHLICDL